MRELPALVKKPYDPSLPTPKEEEIEKKEIERLLSEVDLSAEAIILCGTGLGSIFPKLYALLDKSYIFVIEEEEAMIKKFSSHSINTTFFAHPRSFLFYLFSSFQLEEILRSIGWKIGFSSYQILSFSNSYSLQEKIGSIFPSIHREIAMTLSEYADLGIEGYKNIYCNYLQLESSSSLASWKDSCKGLPVVICGGGASLQQVLPTIDPSKSLIFAGGQSLDTLFQHGIPIDLGASMDPRASVDKVKGVYPNLPFCFHGKTNPDHFSYLNDELIYLSCNPHHPLESWLWEEEIVLDAGWNVINTLVAAALYLGCGPIILAGVDLAFSEDGYYGKDSLPIFEEERIETEDFRGEKIFTKNDLLQAKKWLARKGEENPGRIFLAAESGLSKGENIPLFPQEKWKELPARDYRSFLARPDLRRSILPTQEKRREKLERVMHSLDSCLEKVSIMIESSLSQIEPLDHEIAHMLILKPYWDIWHWSFEKEVEKEGEFSSWKMALHQLLFFQEMANKHKKIIQEVMTRCAMK